ATKARQGAVSGKAQVVDTPADVVESHAVADDHEARGRQLASYHQRRIEEIVVALRSADVRHETDGRAGEPELVAHGLAAHTRMESRSVHAGGDRPHPARR